MPKQGMTIAEYVMRNGTCCPICRSDDLTGNDVDINEGVATQDVYCNECDASWTDVYVLQAYRSLETEEAEPVPILGKDA